MNAGHRVDGGGRRLIYADSFGDGHHVALHARAVLKSAVARGRRCLWLTSAGALEHPASRQLLGDLGGDLEIQVGPFPAHPANVSRAGAWPWYEVRHFAALRGGLRSLPAEWDAAPVYLAWLDHCPRVLGALGMPSPRFPYCGLHMHVSLHERANAAPTVKSVVRARGWSDRLVRRMYASGGLQRIAVLIRPFAEFVRRTTMPGWERVVYVPDLAQVSVRMDRTQARARLGVSDRDCVILSYGALSLRKGVGELLRSLEGVSEPGSWVVHLAGSQDAETRALIADRSDDHRRRGLRIIEWNRFLNDEEESVAFAAADLVWMGYRGFLASSGVLLQAASARLPVVATHEGVIGETTREWGLGPVVDTSDIAAVRAALESLRAAPSLRKEYGARGEPLAEEHSPGRFAERILKMVSDIE
ncbi:MAG: glycosyltransferase family 4 protein [Verrucomicrobiales bacterium]|nr:glycosyltransferase family 4 protein [Verrucomicrobiales bacterium]